jgi:hypothetical protein
MCSKASGRRRATSAAFAGKKGCIQRLHRATRSQTPPEADGTREV